MATYTYEITDGSKVFGAAEEGNNFFLDIQTQEINHEINVGDVITYNFNLDSKVTYNQNYNFIGMLWQDFGVINGIDDRNFSINIDGSIPATNIKNYTENLIPFSMSFTVKSKPGTSGIFDIDESTLTLNGVNWNSVVADTTIYPQVYKQTFNSAIKGTNTITNPSNNVIYYQSGAKHLSFFSYQFYNDGVSKLNKGDIIEITFNGIQITQPLETDSFMFNNRMAGEDLSKDFYYYLFMLNDDQIKDFVQGINVGRTMTISAEIENLPQSYASFKNIHIIETIPTKVLRINNKSVKSMSIGGNDFESFDLDGHQYSFSKNIDVTADEVKAHVLSHTTWVTDQSLPFDKTYKMTYQGTEYVEGVNPPTSSDSLTTWNRYKTETLSDDYNDTYEGYIDEISSPYVKNISGNGADRVKWTKIAFPNLEACYSNINYSSSLTDVTLPEKFNTPAQLTTLFGSAANIAKITFHWLDSTGSIVTKGTFAEIADAKLKGLDVTYSKQTGITDGETITATVKYDASVADTLNGGTAEFVVSNLVVANPNRTVTEKEVTYYINTNVIWSDSNHGLIDITKWPSLHPGTKLYAPDLHIISGTEFTINVQAEHGYILNGGTPLVVKDTITKSTKPDDLTSLPQKADWRIPTGKHAYTGGPENIQADLPTYAWIHGSHYSTYGQVSFDDSAYVELGSGNVYYVQTNGQIYGINVKSTSVSIYKVSSDLKITGTPLQTFTTTGGNSYGTGMWLLKGTDIYFLVEGNTIIFDTVKGTGTMVTNGKGIGSSGNQSQCFFYSDKINKYIVMISHSGSTGMYYYESDDAITWDAPIINKNEYFGNYDYMGIIPWNDNQVLSLLGSKLRIIDIEKLKNNEKYFTIQGAPYGSSGIMGLTKVKEIVTVAQASGSFKYVYVSKPLI